MWWFDTIKALVPKVNFQDKIYSKKSIVILKLPNQFYVEACYSICELFKLQF